MPLRALVAVVLLFCCFPRGAGAQPSEADTAAARVLFDEGRRLGEQDRWEEAADRFRRAVALRASPSVRYNLAVALDHVGKLVECAGQLRVALQEATPRDPARAPSEVLLRAVEPRIARLTIRVEGDLASVEVRLDGEVVPESMLGAAGPVDPGAHAVEVRRGRARVSRDVALEPGGEAEVTLEAPAAPADVTPAPPPPPPGGGPVDHGAGPAPRAGVSWPLVILGGGLVGAGVVLDVAPSSARNGRFDGLDFVPVGLYVAGAVAAALGAL